MPKTKNSNEKQEHMSPEEVKISLAEKNEQITDKECAIELEKVLKEHSRAIQPYLEYAQQAVIPRVRLVRVKPTEVADEDKKEADVEAEGN